MNDLLHMPSFGVAFVMALVISICVLVALRKEMNNVAPNNQAGDYLKKDSFNLQVSSDEFVYKTVTKTRINRNNNMQAGRTGTRPHSGPRRR